MVALRGRGLARLRLYPAVPLAVAQAATDVRLGRIDVPNFRLSLHPAGLTVVCRPTTAGC
jgi:hypothetical protein